MYKITSFAYDTFELQHDLGSGQLLSSSQVIKAIKNKTFKSIWGALKFASEYIGTAYHKADWVFEEDLDCNGKDGWALHIIVDDNMKWANEKMICDFHKGKTKLRDLIVNIFIEPC